MRRIGIWALVGLIGYSALLAAVEARRGAAVVRVYLEDPPEPVLFGHVNTALSAALLVAIAVLFAAALRLEAAAGRPWRFFPASQVAFFLLLAADERFRLLPAGARALGIGESALYAGVAILELGLLLGPGQLRRMPRRALLVAGAGALFVLSSVLDLVTHEFRMRHAAEELPKIWSVALLLVYAWRSVEDAVASVAHAGVPIAEAAPDPRAGRGPGPPLPGPAAAGPTLPGRTPRARPARPDPLPTDRETIRSRD